MLRFMLGMTILFFSSAIADAQARVYRDRVQPQWFSNGERFWYRVDLKDKGRTFVVVDAIAGTRTAAFEFERRDKA